MKKLIICEMANNHMGDMTHGKTMITQFGEVAKKYPEFEFAWKFQFRDFSTFIHKDYKDRMDIKYVKRFTETSLTQDQFLELKTFAEQNGFQTLCTGFDENSIDTIMEMGFDIIKVASCSFTDWPLLNKVVSTSKPIILSTAGTTLDDIDRVVSFMKNRNKDFSLMHCVGEYPTKPENLQLNQIDLLLNRYPGVKIGYSTHEEPDEYSAIQLALAKGAVISEKHVAVDTPEYPINAYSVTPEQMDNWLEHASRALKMCGQVEKPTPSTKELSDLAQFKRGVFVNKDINPGEPITKDDVYYAWPNVKGQVLANNMSKYNKFTSLEGIKADQPIMFDTTQIVDTRKDVWDIVQDVKSFLNTTDVVYPGQAQLEISHHYGIDKFYETGITMITVVNREYCKKLIIVLPNQNHPEQYHHQKEETFVVLHGKVELTLDGVTKTLTKGDVVTIERETRHSFTTTTGCVIEEVSSTHYVNDSYYTDPAISQNQSRKTFVTHWL